MALIKWKELKENENRIYNRFNDNFIKHIDFREWDQILSLNNFWFQIQV
jgi:hypothetical protein